MLCDACNGARFNAETLAVRFKGKNDRRRAGDERRRGGRVLRGASARSIIACGCCRTWGLAISRSASRARRSPAAKPSASSWSRSSRRCETLTSGARARPARAHRHTLYVLDEPTVGLHMADVEKLIRVLHRLVDAGNTVVVIEHNLDVIAEADWIIDLGPEGGDGGGRSSRRVRRATS